MFDLLFLTTDFTEDTEKKQVKSKQNSLFQSYYNQNRIIGILETICSGHRAQGTGHRAQGSELRAQGTEHRAQGCEKLNPC